MIDLEYLQGILLRLLRVHSPTGYTDPIVRVVCEELEALKVKFELTRRGAIRINVPGREKGPERAVVAHLDTLGALVRELKPNGRLGVVPVGTWSARWAEGARVSVFTDERIMRGTLLPLMASGHVYDLDVDTQPVSWDNLELRVDETAGSREDLERLGFQVGDFVGIDSNIEILDNGYINGRHLDDKAGVAALFASLKLLALPEWQPTTDFHVLLTISEEVGSGASAVLHGEVSEMVSVDNGTCAPGQASREFGVTVAMADSTGPFDYHLTHHLLHLCRQHHVPHVRDVFRHYRCDSASAVEAGNDIRTALVTFGVDASHGYERTHMNALENIARLVVHYANSEPVFRFQKETLGSLRHFPTTRKVPVTSVLQNHKEPLAQQPPEPDEAP